MQSCCLLPAMPFHKWAANSALVRTHRSSCSSWLMPPSRHRCRAELLNVIYAPASLACAFCSLKYIIPTGLAHILPNMSLASLTFPLLLLRSKTVPETVSAAPPNPSPPPVAGIHHIKFPVCNLDASLAWYTSVMSAFHFLSLDHYTSRGRRYAAILSLPALGETKLELR